MRINDHLCLSVKEVSLRLILLIFLISLVMIFNKSVPAYVDNGDDSDILEYQNFNFVTAGDFGCGAEPARTVNGMMKKDPRFVLVLGDLSYKKSINCWLRTIFPLGGNGTVKISFGEHDLNNNLTKYNDYINYFNMTTPYYSFNYGNVHFLAMSTGKNSIIPYQNGSEQYDFIHEDLRNAHNNKSVNWIIVYSFRPFYSSFTAHSGQAILPETYHPLFDMYDVDVVLQAHNHNYQRTFPLQHNESSFSSLYHPVISDNNRTEYKDPKGTIFLTVGTAGALLHNFSGIAPFIVEQFESHGFLNVDILSSKNELNLEGTFYENVNMHKKDHFSITKMKIVDK